MIMLLRAHLLSHALCSLLQRLEMRYGVSAADLVGGEFHFVPDLDVVQHRRIIDLEDHGHGMRFHRGSAAERWRTADGIGPNPASVENAAQPPSVAESATPSHSSTKLRTDFMMILESHASARALVP